MLGGHPRPGQGSLAGMDFHERYAWAGKRWARGSAV